MVASKFITAAAYAVAIMAAGAQAQDTNSTSAAATEAPTTMAATTVIATTAAPTSMDSMNSTVAPTSMSSMNSSSTGSNGSNNSTLPAVVFTNAPTTSAQFAPHVAATNAPYSTIPMPAESVSTRAPAAPATSANGFTCGAGLNVCQVYDPVTTNGQLMNTCYDAAKYVCLQPTSDYKGQFLCPATAPNLCGRSCYVEGAYQCAWNSHDIYSSQLLQEFTIGNVTFSTAIIPQGNGTYTLAFIPAANSSVNYVIAHVLATSYTNTIGQQNVNMTQETDDITQQTVYVRDVILPATDSLYVQYTFAVGQNNVQYENNASNVTLAEMNTIFGDNTYQMQIPASGSNQTQASATNVAGQQQGTNSVYTSSVAGPTMTALVSVDGQTSRVQSPAATISASVAMIFASAAAVATMLL